MLDTIRLNLKAAMLLLIAGESLAATVGLGYRIFVVRRYVAMDIIIPYVLWMTVLLFLTNWCIQWVVAALCLAGQVSRRTAKALKRRSADHSRKEKDVGGEHVSHQSPRGGGELPRNSHGPGGRNVIINNVRLNIRAGEFLSLVGPTGCGKSTLLRLILGAQCPTRGTVLVAGQPVTGVNRDCGIVFQKYSLFPHLKVLDNIAFGPLLEHTTILQRVLHTPPLSPRAAAVPLEEARECLERIGLRPGDGDKYPYELSGGMQQRVAIAQAPHDAAQSPPDGRTLWRPGP